VAAIFLSRQWLTTVSSNNNPTPIRILVVDDHPLLREGVKATLDNESDMEVVGEAANGRVAVEAFRLQRPDVVLMDIQMPDMNGIDAIVQIRSTSPAARIVVLTTYKGDVNALRALRAGAVGYLLKGELMTELVSTIRVVHAGGRRIPVEIAADLAAHLGEEALSEREIQVLRFVAVGNSNKQAAMELGVTEETVKAHMKNICAKLSANDRTHAVTIAIRRGILEL
jgi:DNA-binding NarL/FixJ family response regulator